MARRTSLTDVHHSEGSQMHWIGRKRDAKQTMNDEDEEEHAERMLKDAKTMRRSADLHNGSRSTSCDDAEMYEYNIDA